MPYQDKKQQQAPDEKKNARPQEQFAPGQRSFGVPNSLMRAVPITPPAGTPNSVMREMEEDDSGALFRGRGFDPTVGAHELSHTVRRESAHSPVRQSVPSGTIQRDPDGDRADLESKSALIRSYMEKYTDSFIAPYRDYFRERFMEEEDEDKKDEAEGMWEFFDDLRFQLRESDRYIRDCLRNPRNKNSDQERELKQLLEEIQLFESNRDKFDPLLPDPDLTENWVYASGEDERPQMGAADTARDQARFAVGTGRPIKEETKGQYSGIADPKKSIVRGKRSFFGFFSR